MLSSDEKQDLEQYVISIISTMSANPEQRVMLEGIARQMLSNMTASDLSSIKHLTETFTRKINESGQQKKNSIFSV